MSILVGTHRPYHEREARGLQLLRPGVQGPDVAAPGTIGRIIVRQQLPDHPASVLRAGVQGPNVADFWTIGTRIIQRQELPWHPRSFLWGDPPPVPAQIPFRRALITAQELPWHPRSFFHAGTHPVAYEDVQVFVIV